MKTKILTPNALEEAAYLLKKGELVAFPTETVYGLGAPIFNPKSIEQIFIQKGRPQDNPLIAHVGSIAEGEKLGENLPPLFYVLAKVFFPGPLTLVVKKNPQVPEIVSPGLETIAIRMPSHPVAQELLLRVGEPLVAPSANLSGFPSSTTCEHVLQDFKGKIAAVIDAGPCLHGIESTVIDLVSYDLPTIVRPGAISQEVIERALGKKVPMNTKGRTTSPGMKYRHYSPKTPVSLFSKRKEFEEHLQQHSNLLILSSEPLKRSHYFLESKTLYSYLRLADEKNVDEVVIFYQNCDDAALLNRLEKLAGESDCH